VRSVSQRLEGIEDGLDRVDQRLESAGSGSSLEGRLIAIEADLERIRTKLDKAAAKPRPKAGGKSTARKAQGGSSRRSKSAS
jgi:hypothetical protein